MRAVPLPGALLALLRSGSGSGADAARGLADPCSLGSGVEPGGDDRDWPLGDQGAAHAGALDAIIGSWVRAGHLGRGRGQQKLSPSMPEHQDPGSGS